MPPSRSFFLGLMFALSFGLPRTASADRPVRLVLAASPRAGEDWPPRKLFNSGLKAEESGNLVLACQLYLASRLSQRASFADELYARGAALRLVRILIGYDDDAAVAAAMLAAEMSESSDLAPIVRGLLRRLEGAGAPEERVLQSTGGTILSVRFQRATGAVLIELEHDNGDRRIVSADGPIGPFSAGHRVRALMRRTRGSAAASWRLIAMGSERADSWQILRVRGLPGAPVVPDGAPLEPLRGRQNDAQPAVEAQAGGLPFRAY